MRHGISEQQIATILEFPSRPLIPQPMPMPVPAPVQPIEQTAPKPKRIRKAKPKPEYQFKIEPSKYRAIFHRFLNLGMRSGNSGKLHIQGNTLIHRTFHNFGREEHVELIAKRIGTGKTAHYIGNSSILPTVGCRMAWGSVQDNRSETELQRELARLIPMVPFNVFSEAKLNIENIKIIARGEAETIHVEYVLSESELRRKYKLSGYWRGHRGERANTERHFTGASLFKVDGKTFLFDCDRRELEHRIFNPFLVRLPRECKTIAAAYEMLKPKAVRQAEAKGLTVLRQGEWFFIPVTDKRVNNKLNTLKGKLNRLQSFELRAGANRPNDAKGIRINRSGKLYREPEFNAGIRWSEFQQSVVKASKGVITFCTDVVEHRGREHKSLHLRGWYSPIPNTGTFSWQISGQVD